MLVYITLLLVLLLDFRPQIYKNVYNKQPPVIKAYCGIFLSLWGDWNLPRLEVI